MPTSRDPARAGRSVVGLVALASVAYIVSTVPGVRAEAGYSRLWEVGVFNLVTSGAAVAVLLRATTVRRARLPWALVGLGMASYASGTLYFSLHLQPLADMPYPSVSDGLWLAFYPVALGGVLRLAQEELRRGRRGLRPATALDGLAAGLTLAALSAAFAFDRITATAGGTVTAVLTNFAYPVADLLLLTMVASVLVVLGRRAGALWWVLALGFVCFAVADTWFLLQVAADTYQPGSLVDATWAAAGTLVAVAAWWPEKGRDEPRGTGMSAVLLPTLCGLASVVVLAAAPFVAITRLGILLALGALLAVFARMAQALHQAVTLASSRQEARTDELTGLPNRRWLYEELERLPASGAGGGSKVLLLLDLDQFKEVNDALGHNVGDQLLRQVAARLHTLLGARHALARLGGDEFAIIVDGTVADGGDVADQVLRALREPFDVGLMTLHVDGSIGLAHLEQSDPSRSLACADVAMYRAKSMHVGVHVYDNEDDSDGWDRLSRVEALRSGIGAGELELDFQPIVDAVTGVPKALEALVRWRHPSRGRVPPDDFLPLAEQSGLMHDVTMAVLALALDHAVLLDRTGIEVPVAVNFSASDLLDRSLAESVITELGARGLGPQALRIEITETLFVADRTRTDPVLQRLRGHGIPLSVDDYGTGYSSLAYLHDLPVSELKLDRIFTDRVLSDVRTATIVRSTIALAHDLGLTVVGEGVENAAQLDWLREAGLDSAQGWHVARPMSAQETLTWLEERQVRLRA